MKKLFLFILLAAGFVAKTQTPLWRFVTIPYETGWVRGTNGIRIDGPVWLADDTLHVMPSWATGKIALAGKGEDLYRYSWAQSKWILAGFSQTNSDWNAVSGVAQILNKPFLRPVIYYHSGWGLSMLNDSTLAADSSLVLTRADALNRYVSKTVFTLDSIANQAALDTKVSGGTITWPIFYNTPTTGTFSSGILNFSPTLANQAAWYILGNHTGSSAAPTFGLLNVHSINASGSIYDGSKYLSDDGTWKVASAATSQAAYYVYNNPTASSALPVWSKMKVQSIDATGSSYDGTKYLSDDGTWKTVRVKTLFTDTYSATPTFDGTYINHTVTLTGNVTSVAVSNLNDGETIFVKFIQDATGSRTVPSSSASWISGNAEIEGGSITLTTTGAAKDVVGIKRMGTKYIVKVVKDVK